MDEETPAESSAPHMEQELEFRPWVKWCGIGLAGLASIGVFLGTYYIGYSQGRDAGYTEATCSGVVQQSLNEAALKNVLNFMRLASSSDDRLLNAAANLEASFGWIIDPEVRMEAEWSLVQALLSRGKGEPALAVLTPLLERAPRNLDWAHRALSAGAMLVDGRLYNHAATCFRQAADVFAECSQTVWQQEALGQLIALEMCVSQDSDSAISALEQLIAELKSDDEGSRQLRSIALVHIGTLHRYAGKQEVAQQKFKEALATVENLRTVRPEGSVSRGVALLETGDAAAAEPMLRIALENPGTSLSDVSTRVLALRYLALLEQRRDHNVTALAMLHRAQGMAEGRIMQGNGFWPCLFDQRGWMHYMVQNYQTALLDFNAAIAATQDSLLQMQPLEGAARCYLELGKAAEALPMLEKCLQLRSQHTPGDRNAIGRLHLLLGQLYDQQAKTTEAEVAYGTAVQNLTGDTPDELDNRRTALLGRAYVLMELKRWAEAYSAWEQVLPLVEDQFDRREEARSQMRRIKPFIQAEPQAEEPAPEQP